MSHPAHTAPAYGCTQWVCPGVTDVVAAADVTDEIVDLAETYAEGFSPDGRVDWEGVIDRMDGAELRDGTVIAFGPEYDTPAMRKIKREVGKLREAASGELKNDPFET